MKTLDTILKWLTFAIELLNDGREKYAKHFDKPNVQPVEAAPIEVQSTETIENNATT